MTDPLLVRAVRGERTERPPVWLMRQAGRHLPEYRDLREDYSFREAIETPDVAEEITLQPYRRYGVDGVVMFSDILTCLEPLGFDYRIESGVGPVVDDPVSGPDDVVRRRGDVREELGFVADLLDRLSESVADEDAVLGFAGGPFTLASYVVAGGPDRGRMELRKFRARHSEAFETLMERFADVVAEYLAMQADHGADAVQLFDTYAGVLSPADYREFVLPLHRRIIDSVDLPSLIFVRNMGGRLDSLQGTGADAVALDWTVEMGAARAQLGETPVQGNLDPSFLFADPDVVREKASEVIEAAGPRGHVLNLGHGVNKETPVEGVEAFVETAKEWEWE